MTKVDELIDALPLLRQYGLLALTLTSYQSI